MMATRAEMVEKAAEALHDYCGCGELAVHDEGIRQEAIAVLDVVLPQVSTVAELEALPSGTVVLDAGGMPTLKVGAVWMAAGVTSAASHEDVAYYSPLTVVWQP